jgi:CRP-like cAMP-binding protein
MPGSAPAPAQARDDASLCRPINVRELMEVLPNTRRVTFKAGHAVLKEGTRATTCYLVERGTVNVSKKLPGGLEFTLATMRKGEFIGEMAMLSGMPRSASAVAAGPVQVLEIKRSDFARLLNEEHSFAVQLSLHFACALARRCSRMLKLIEAESPDGRVLRRGTRREVDIRHVLDKVYSLWAI